MIGWRGSRPAAAPSPAGVPKILFACMGNLCRSPMAEVIARFRARANGLSSAFDFDSAGTHDIGGHSRFDPRAFAALERKGYGGATARRPRVVAAQDFERFDLILGMDTENLASLRRICPAVHAPKLGLFLDLAPGFEGGDVPDPYYGSADGFDRVVVLCEEGIRGLLAASGGTAGALRQG